MGLDSMRAPGRSPNGAIVPKVAAIQIIHEANRALGLGAESGCGDKDRGLLKNSALTVIIDGDVNYKADLIFNIAFI